MYRFNSFVQVRTEEAPVAYFASETVNVYNCNRDDSAQHKDERNPVEIEKAIKHTNLNGRDLARASFAYRARKQNGQKQVNDFSGVRRAHSSIMKRRERQTKAHAPHKSKRRGQGTV